VLSLGIRYLCGWAMATHPADYESAEWPPHPDRVFMALAAAHFETGGPPIERVALEWLEKLPPPTLATPPAAQRHVVTAFVPVNDVSLPKGSRLTASGFEQGKALLPEHRPRQARQFPVSIPNATVDGEMPTTFLIWRDADVPAEIEKPLGALCRKVSRIGHSASFVQMWVAETPPTATLEPGDNAPVRLRIPTPGRLRQLEHAYAAGRRPPLVAWKGYRAPEQVQPRPTPRSMFDDSLLVFKRVDGTRLGLRSTLLVTAALRGLVMRLGPQPSPEWITGHALDDTPTGAPHLAFIPLAEVEHAHAEGRLLGAAVVFPRHVQAGVSDLLSTLYRVQEEAQRRDRAAFQLHDGDVFEWQMDLVMSADRAWSLRPSTWCGTPSHPSASWATVTPIVLDRFPKRDGDREEAIARACSRIGLPRPLQMMTYAVSPFKGVPRASDFPVARFKIGPPQRVQTHAILRFPESVLGPVILGAARHRGYGLCRPYREGEVAS
jgi:CRISPR-associated protein Csb2